MPARWIKAFRDLKRNRSRSLLAVLAISVGLSGFGSLLATYSILTRELNAGYLATNPASATIVVDRVDDALLNAVRNFSGVGDVEARRALSARIRVKTDEWRNAILFVIPDFHAIRISTLKPQKGKWPPDRGEILIERDAVGVAHTAIGNSLVVKTANGKEHALRVAGTVHDVGQAQARMEQIVYGYIDVATLEELGESPFFDELKLVVSQDQGNQQHIRSVAASLKRTIEACGHHVKDVEIPIPGKHPHADLMGMLLLLKAAFGFFALLLSGFLVLNLFFAIMAGERRQIGIMKAVGAKHMQIAGIYVREVLIMSLISLAIAIPITIVAARGISNFMAVFLNFDLTSYAIAAWVYLLEFAIAVIVPLGAAAYPIWKATRKSVREAIGDYGMGSKQFGNSKMDELIAKLGSMKRPLLLAFRSMFLQRGRLGFTLTALVAGGAIFIAAWNIRASFTHTIDLLFQTFRYDIAASFADTYPVQELEAKISAIPGVESVECWSSAEAIPLFANHSEDDAIRIAGLPERTKMLSLNIVEGRNFRSGDQYTLIVNSRLLKQQPELRVGNRVSFRIGSRTQQWEIIGLSREPFAGPSAYAPYQTISFLANQEAVTKNVRIRAVKQDRAFVSELKQKVEKVLSQNGWKATTVAAIRERRVGIDEHNSVIYAFLIGVALLIVIVGGLGLMTTMSISVLERRREVGVMRAIGANKRAIFSLILAEGAFIGVLSWVLSLIPAILLSKALGNIVAGMMFRTNLDFVVDMKGILAWLVLTLLFGGIASYIPARHASRLPVSRLVEYE